MPKLSIVVVVRAQARSLGRLVAALAKGTAAGTAELLLVDDASADGSAAILDAWQRRHPGLVRCLRRGLGAASHPAFDDGLASATGEWVIFPNASRALPVERLRRLHDFLRRPDDPSLALVCLDALPPGEASAAAAKAAGDGEALRRPIELLQAPPEASQACFRRAPLLASRMPADGRARPDFVATAVLSRYLLAAGSKSVAWLPEGAAAAPEPPPASAWALASTYGEAIANGPLALLDAAGRAGARAPAWLQRAVLHDLHWYYAADSRPKSPTAMVSNAMADVFHHLVQRVMDGVDTEIVEGLDPASVGVEVREALLSYKRSQGTPAVAITGHDADQGLVRLSYHVHGRRHVEAFLLDGAPVVPAHAQYRSCRYFRRTLCHERIVWLPVGEACMLEVRLDSAPAALSLGQQPPGAAWPAGSCPAAGDMSLGIVRAAFAPRIAGRSAAALKAGALHWLARRGFVRRRFARAWVFHDRGEEADDNAEHQYRWTRRHHPEINAWFLLDRASPDWARLEREGFRLVPPGLARRLLMLNSEHLLSSQPSFASAGFDPGLYGALPWRFTVLQHGVIMNDLSHWLNSQPLDVLVTSSPAEERAIAGDDTPYVHTSREVRRTGLPRHDRLLELSRQLPPAEVDTILLMPTWRGRLSEAGGDAAARAAFGESEYARGWRALLGSEALRRAAERHGKRLVFMPHPNSAPFVDAFEVPAHVEVTTKAATRIQPLFCRSAAMVTDYSSVAFEMAFLRRPVVYYQFDRERFFGGDHNWREGYFSYDRDGFGPVAMEPDEVARQLDLLLSPGAPALGEYLARMERALPDRDGGACRRVHEAVLGIRRPCAIGVAAPGLPTEPREAAA